MATYFMFGTYSDESLSEISAQRTTRAVDLVKKFDGKVEAMYALLGEEDLIFIVDFPDTAQAMKASVALTKSLGIAFSTTPAVTAQEFDRMMAEI